MRSITDLDYRKASRLITGNIIVIKDENDI